VKTVGLVGGLGPESTVDYYRRILATWEAGAPGSAPSILIHSLDVQEGIRLVTHDRAGLLSYLLDSLHRLAGGGADFAALLANTAHVVFDELAERSPLPLVSIVEACAAEADRRGHKRLGLLGTRFTMEARFYPDVFGRRGIGVVSPEPAEQDWLHERYIGQLLQGEFRDDTREGVTGLIARLRDRERVDGVILGGTELPLLLRDDRIADLPTLDTTVLHVEAIVARLRHGGGP